MTTSDHISDEKARASGADIEDAPEDPRLRMMRRLVTFLLIVLIAGTLTVVIALLLKLKSTDLSSDDPVAAIGLGPSESLAEASSTADRITLVIENAETGARRVVILDAADYRVVGAVAAEREAETE